MALKKKKLKKIFSFLRNKYVISSLLLLTWLFFFDKNDILSQITLTKKIYQLEEEKQYYVNEIQKTKSDMQELITNPKNLEKFAREKYLMKKDNEDIFVIVERKSDNTNAKELSN